MEGYALRNDEYSSSYKNDGCVYCVYLHGKIERINGYDCVLLTELPHEEGKFPITIYLSDGTPYRCTMYFWYPNGFPMGKGLICLEDDTEANRQAQILYDNKSITLSW